MKAVYLLRHAKSSWDDPELKDFERPLNARGQRDVPKMAERFLGRGQRIGCLVCSPAVRARTTALLFADSVGFPADQIISNPELYFAGSGMFLKAIKHVDEGCDSVMLVGHNPAITEFANELGAESIDNIPTCGLVQFSLPIDHWAEAEMGTAALLHFDFPKKSGHQDTVPSA